MELQKDIREFIASFLSHRVEFLLVGGYALAFHGAPRFTEDIDFLVRISPENAERIEAALASFGFQSVGISQADFLEPEQVIQLGRPPHRIDLLTSITAVSWEEAWSERQEVDLGGHKVSAIGREHLIVNKRASGRLQDLADVARLERVKSSQGPKA
ncbi:MAG: nucleotidyl transferase AbiEii/AbiGii toxin family protein [Limisphaerales bacterium]